MKSKKALTKNTLSVILAVIGLAIILPIAWTIIKAPTTNTEEQSAQNTINTITEKINSLEEGQKNEFIIQGFKNSQNWFLMAWNRNDPVDEKPEACFLNPCLYLCKINEEAFATTWKQRCETKGFSREIKNKNIIIQNFDIAGLFPVPFPGKSIDIKPSPNIIQLRPNIMEIHINKTADSIIISYYSDKYLEYHPQNE